MLNGRVLPRLGDGAVAERVRLVRPDVDDVARLVLFVVVKDGVCGLSGVGSLSQMFMRGL